MRGNSLLASMSIEKVINSFLHPTKLDSLWYALLPQYVFWSYMYVLVVFQSFCSFLFHFSLYFLFPILFFFCISELCSLSSNTWNKFNVPDVVHCIKILFELMHDRLSYIFLHKSCLSKFLFCFAYALAIFYIIAEVSKISRG